MNKRPFTCCFTGHRNLPIGQEEEIWKRVYACLEPLLEESVRYFGVGGALGFDTLVAEKLLMLRESRPEICIILVQPFPDYQSRRTPAVRPFWPETDIWWTAPPAALPGVPAPLAAPPTLCTMRKGRACGCGMWRRLVNEDNFTLSNRVGFSIIRLKDIALCVIFLLLLFESPDNGMFHLIY